jgi:hypothetical protein
LLTVTADKHIATLTRAEASVPPVAFHLHVPTV